MEERYNVTNLIIAEKLVAKAINEIDMMKKPRNRTVQAISDPLVEIANLVASSLGRALPEECIFDDAPYPIPLITDDVDYINHYVSECIVYLNRINGLMHGNESDLGERLVESIVELNKTLQMLDTSLYH